MAADEEETKAEIYGKLEKLYSAVNRLRFYMEMAATEEAANLAAEVEKLRKEIALSSEEVESFADELDEYYITGSTKHGEDDPLSHWTTIVYQRLKP